MSLAPDDPRHGTLNGYANLKCRCDRCRSANTAYNRKYRENLPALGPDDPRHGTWNAYGNYKCRCAKCLSAPAKSRADKRFNQERARELGLS